MGYKFSITSSRDNSFTPERSCCFARLTDCINSLLDMIFSVSLILFQSSMLKITDLGLPSGVVMNSIFGNSSALSMIKSPYKHYFKPTFSGFFDVGNGFFISVFHIFNLSYTYYSVKKLRGEHTPAPLLIEGNK